MQALGVNPSRRYDRWFGSAAPASPVAAAILLLALLACVRGGTERAASPGPAGTLNVARPLWTGPLGEAINDEHARFTAETGIAVRWVPAPGAKPDRVDQYLEWLRKGSAAPDVYQADVTEIGSLAEHLLDLRPYLDEEARTHMPDVMSNYVVGGRLLALPWGTDIGVLLYRADLLEKYRFTHPPETWRELEAMAARIQAGERASGHAEFWGFAWPGRPDDDLLCMALEVQASHGGGRIIEPDATISVNNPQTARALRVMKAWVGVISPPAVTAYGPDDARNLWYSGDAAFLRTWPNTYSRSQALPHLRGKVAVTSLPSGGGGHVGTLGGWQLSVSRHSEHPQAAAELVRFVSRREEVRRRTIRLSAVPTILDVFDDPEVVRSNPFAPQVKQAMASGVVARPSTVAGKTYAAVSEAYWNAVHSVLTGQLSAEDALGKLEQDLVRITGFRTRPPAGRGM